MNQEVREHLLRSLEEMRAEYNEEDRKNPTISRLFEFWDAYAAYVVEGKGGDQEGARLEDELEWMAANRKLAMPARTHASMLRILRCVTPKYRERLDELSVACAALALQGRGDRTALRQEIATLRQLGVLNENEAGQYEQLVAPPSAEQLRLERGGRAAERRLVRYMTYGSRPWWKFWSDI